MKKIAFLILVLNFVTISVSLAQSTTHPTIDSVRVRYRSAPSTTTVQGIQSRFTVIPEAYVKLKTTDNVSKIYFKVYKTNDSLLYQIQYDLNSPVVNNAQGKKLFERSGNRLFISPGMVLPLKLYKYKLQTADSLQVLSTFFTITQ